MSKTTERVSEATPQNDPAERLTSDAGKALLRDIGTWGPPESADVRVFMAQGYVEGIEHEVRRATVERIRAALAEVDPDKKGAAIPAILDTEAGR